jgi:hypothetical protein
MFSRVFAKSEIAAIEQSSGLQPLGPDAETVKMIVQLKASGYNNAEIGRQVGMSRKAVARALERMAKTTKGGTDGKDRIDH